MENKTQNTNSISAKSDRANQFPNNQQQASQSFGLPSLDLSDPVVQQILNGAGSVLSNNNVQGAVQASDIDQSGTQTGNSQANSVQSKSAQAMGVQANDAQVTKPQAVGVPAQNSQNQEQLAQQLYELELQQNKTEMSVQNNAAQQECVQPDSVPISKKEIRALKKRAKKEKHKRSALVGFVEFVVIIALAIGLAYGLTNYVVKPYEIPSESMEETILVDDRVLSETLSYAFGGAPQQGDIVTFIDVEDSNRTLIKRVIATAGQTVDIHDNNVYVDGQKLDEPYTQGKESKRLAKDSDIAYPYTIPDGYIWVMGDNRTNSSDSRVFGAVPLSNVTGKAFVRYWPLDRISTL